MLPTSLSFTLRIPCCNTKLTEVPDGILHITAGVAQCHDSLLHSCCQEQNNKARSKWFSEISSLVSTLPELRASHTLKDTELHAWRPNSAEQYHDPKCGRIDMPVFCIFQSKHFLFCIFQSKRCEGYPHRNVSIPVCCVHTHNPRFANQTSKVRGMILLYSAAQSRAFLFSDLQCGFTSSWSQ